MREQRQLANPENGIYLLVETPNQFVNHQQDIWLRLNDSNNSHLTWQYRVKVSRWEEASLKLHREEFN
jgi:hypothetical protein